MFADLSVSSKAGSNHASPRSSVYANSSIWYFLRIFGHFSVSGGSRGGECPLRFVDALKDSFFLHISFLCSRFQFLWRICRYFSAVIVFRGAVHRPALLFCALHQIVLITADFNTYLSLNRSIPVPGNTGEEDGDSESSAFGFIAGTPQDPSIDSTEEGGTESSAFGFISESPSSSTSVPPEDNETPLSSSPKEDAPKSSVSTQSPSRSVRRFPHRRSCFSSSFCLCRVRLILCHRLLFLPHRDSRSARKRFSPSDLVTAQQARGDRSNKLQQPPHPLLPQLLPRSRSLLKPQGNQRRPPLTLLPRLGYLKPQNQTVKQLARM